jgi:hypothetical protein
VLLGAVSVSLAQQQPDFQNPNTAAADYSNAVSTLHAAQVVWQSFSGFTSNTCGANGFTVDQVMALPSNTIPPGNAPTWRCVTAPNPYN